MKVEVTEDCGILLKEVFNGVKFETEEGEVLTVCMRDGGFEIGVGINKIPNKRYSIQKGFIERL
jgi:hypothetical protein